MNFPTMAGFNARTFNAGLRVALSEGAIGWIPFYLERADRHFQNQSWIGSTFGEGRLPSDVFREHLLACFITDRSGLKLRHEIGR